MLKRSNLPDPIGRPVGASRSFGMVLVLGQCRDRADLIGRLRSEGVDASQHMDMMQLRAVVNSAALRQQPVCVCLNPQDEPEAAAALQTGHPGLMLYALSADRRPSTLMDELSHRRFRRWFNLPLETDAVAATLINDLELSACVDEKALVLSQDLINFSHQLLVSSQQVARSPACAGDRIADVQDATLLCEAASDAVAMHSGGLFLCPSRQKLTYLLSPVVRPVRHRAQHRRWAIKTEIAPDIWITCDSPLVQRAVSLMLLAAARRCEPGDTVCLSAQPDTQSIRFDISLQTGRSLTRMSPGREALFRHRFCRAVAQRHRGYFETGSPGQPFVEGLVLPAAGDGEFPDSTT